MGHGIPFSVSQVQNGSQQLDQPPQSVEGFQTPITDHFSAFTDIKRAFGTGKEKSQATILGDLALFVVTACCTQIACCYS
jgi:hypothetical protein